MNAILDVHYRGANASVACVQFAGWDDAEPSRVRVSAVSTPSDFVPGRFFERELPCLLHALALEAERFEAIVVDGYGHLDTPSGKGLGAHLADAVPYPVAVVGVAKTPFRLAARFVPVFRGRSRRPLFVSSVNRADEAAAALVLVEKMHGDFRIPTLLKLADRLSRGAG
ncbi:MAG: endonuclease V [Deltaproteobacteria bacterium]|nr:endonuclease V [Deltaproteobacteria bacterium]